ncbi:unnamed protein product [Vicia faba]|uniref:Maturase K n=1 Tax=Vicia faba TaxID=3906 RepID=A0AAV0ZY54_VICFA|nr:unnamed protein product [Vicia faba]
MPPNRRKGKNVVGPSSSEPVSVISLLHPDSVRDYDTNFISRITVKQYYILFHDTTIFDSSLCNNFDWRFYLNSFLKEPRPNLETLEKLSTRNLKRNHHILHWIVTRVLRPRKGGHSRINEAREYLMYILENKFLISWPYYFVSSMFSIRECHKGSSLSYSSMISRILMHFQIDMQNLPCISLGKTQEFNATTLANMWYRWDKDQHAY